MNKDGVEITKRQLNSVYGKFATNPNVTPKIPFIDKDDVILRLHRVGYIDTDFWGLESIFNRSYFIDANLTSKKSR